MKIIDLRILLVFVLFATSCKKDTIATPPAAGESTSLNFSATINGANEVPANASTAKGFGIATFDKINKILSLSVIYSGITPVAMHIHKAAVGANGPVIIGLGNTPFPAQVQLTQKLSTGQEDSLMRNLLYVNIHSATFPGGEIRGQLLR
jgi:CHRD domain